MADIARPTYGIPWADEGEKLAPTDNKQKLGWIQEMMPFQHENWIQNRQDVALTYLMQKGIPEWSNTQEYIADKSVVMSGGTAYVAKTTHTGQPTSNATAWRRLSVATDSAGIVLVTSGGTGSSTAAGARDNLGLGSAALLDSSVVVVKDGSGNFTAGTITATLSGNATTATRLQTARTIAISGGATGTATSFNGSANITIPITGLNMDNATAGTLAITRGGTGSTTATGTGILVLNDSPSLVGNPTAPTPLLTDSSTTVATTAFVQGINSSDTGSAATALTLKTARTINGTSFNGSANITTANWGTARTLSFTGDATGSSSVNGSANVATALTLANSGVTVGTYTKVTVDAKGRVTTGASLLASDVPTLNQNTTGNAATATQLATARTFSLTGAATGSTTAAFNGTANATISVTSLAAASVTGTLPTNTLGNAVTKTSTTGSALIPIGTTAQRDASPTAGYSRINSSTGQFEFYDGSQWVTQGGSTDTDFTIIYPNGGSAASPANITLNSRYVSGNPFLGFHVICIAEVLRNGVWQCPGFSGSGYQQFISHGTYASMYNTNEIIVQTGINSVTGYSALTGGSGGIGVGTFESTLPCRVKIWKVKGAI